MWPVACPSSTMTEHATAGMTVGWLLPKTLGSRPVTTSRIMPPPVAVNTPIMIAGRTGSPYVRAFDAPVAAHSAETKASPWLSSTLHARPLKYVKRAITAPVKARMRYSGWLIAATVPSLMRTSRSMPPPSAESIAMKKNPMMS